MSMLSISFHLYEASVKTAQSPKHHFNGSNRKYSLPLTQSLLGIVSGINYCCLHELPADTSIFLFISQGDANLCGFGPSIIPSCLWNRLDQQVPGRRFSCQHPSLPELSQLHPPLLGLYHYPSRQTR